MKKLRIFIILGAFISLFSALILLTGCGKPALSRPLGLKIDGDTLLLTWNEVEDSVGYTVRINGESRNTRQNRYSLTTLAAGEYRIRVQARGNERNHGNSSWSDEIAFTREAETGLNYVLNDTGTEYSVQGIGSSSPNVVIEDYYRGKPVTSVANNAFQRSQVSSVKFGKFIRSVGKYAFANCGALESIEIPDTVTSIGEYVFQNSRALKSVKLPENLQSIPRYAFNYCTALTEAITGSKLATIEEYAFAECRGLEVFEIQDSITLVEAYAFTGCTALRTVYIGDGLPWISMYTFAKCTALTEVAFGYGLTEIGNFAFLGCTALENVDLPNNITVIGEASFANCTSLSKVSFGADVRKIGMSAFEMTKLWNDAEGHYVYCNNWLLGIKETKDDRLESVDDLSNQIVGIADGVFRASVITGIMIPDSVKYIGALAFVRCENLSTVRIGANTERIGEYAFFKCTNLSGVGLDTNKALTDIGHCAFYGCERLSRFQMPATVTHVGIRAFNETALWSSSNGIVYANEWVVGYTGQASSITVREGTVGIAEYAFYGSRLYNVTLPDSLKYVSRGAFYGSVQLRTVELPEGLREIGDYSFYGCQMLGTSGFEIPNSVTSIGRSAFYGCTYIGMDGNFALPDQLKSIGDYAFHSSGVRNIVIPASVTTIGRYAFAHSESLESVKIGNGITSVGVRAFSGCVKLGKVTFGTAVVSIGNYAFYDCTALTELSLPDGVKSIGAYAFYGNEKLESLSLGSVNDIGIYAFYGCKKLKNLILPDSVTSVGSNAFRNCSSLSTVVLGKDIQTMGMHVFYACNSLTIYSQASAEGKSWNGRWNSSFRPVICGVTLSEGDAPYIVSFTKSEEGVLYLAMGGLAVPSREGYVFGGWATEPNGETAVYTTEQLEEVANGTTLYAVWIVDLS